MTPQTLPKSMPYALGHLPTQPQADAPPNGETRGRSLSRDAVGLLTEKLRRAKIEVETAKVAKPTRLGQQLRRKERDPSPRRAHGEPKAADSDELRHFSRSPEGFKVRADSSRPKVASPRAYDCMLAPPLRAPSSSGALQPRHEASYAGPPARDERFARPALWRQCGKA